ncbi:MAG TPA: TonB-dependent receptor [Gammaproteobacteria bacterium]|nr:TonB-dependent receptor [Gammaproteobacteria bacterium]
MRRHWLNAAIRAAIASQLAAAGLAQAQQGGLEEIVVTATRRETNLQDVPISVIAITGDDLERRGVDSVERLSTSVPNLNMIGGLSGPGASSFTVRGIPRVGTYIDGVWQVGTAGLLTRNLVDLERVEVLRGPQGTLYGRDSTGGAIRLVTKRPAEEFGAQLGATIGSLDRRDLNLSVDLPLGEKLRTKWTAASLERNGYIQSLTVDQDYGRIDDEVLRGDVLWLPTEKLSFRFNYQSNEQSPTEARIQAAVFPELSQTFGIGAAPGAVRLAAGIIQLYTLAGQPINALTQQAGFPGGQVGKWQTRSEITVPDRFEDEQLSVDVQWSLSDYLSLQFLTARMNQYSNSYVDWDNTQYNVFNDIFANDLDLISQEIQISGDGERIEWVAGAYYWEQENVSRNPSYSMGEFNNGQLNINNVFATPTCTNVPVGFLPCQATFGIIMGQQADDQNLARQRGWAVFGETVIHLTDALDLTVGYRHHDQTNQSSALAPIPGVTAAKPPRSNMAFGPGDIFAAQRVGLLDSASFDKGTSRLAVNYEFTDDIMGYVGYSEGFNSGGFGVEQLTCKRRVSPFEPEELKNYELGLRSDLRDGELRFNATLFHTKWDSIQLAGESIDDCFTPPRVGTNLRTQNVAAAEAEGLEFELTIAATDNLLFNVNLGLLDTQYVGIATPVPGLTLNTEFSQAPKTTGNVGVQHTANLRSGATFVTRVDYSHSDQFWRSQIPNFRTEYYGLPGQFDEGGDYGLVNARLTYTPMAANWELSVFGTNLTNEYYLNSGFFHSLWDIDFATVGRPREAGVSLKLMFD